MSTRVSEVDQKKLVKVLRDNEVRISNKGNVCLYDLITNVVESKNPKTYVAKMGDKYDMVMIKDKPYVSKEDCANIIKEAKFKKCKNIYTKILIGNGDKASIIDAEKEIFQFEGHKFMAFFVDDDEGKWDVWIKGSEAAEVLGYANMDQAVRVHVTKKNKCTFAVLMETFESLRDRDMKKMHPDTMFVNMSGFFNLIHRSKKETAKKIRDWIDEEVLPSLARYGVYVMQPDKIVIKKLYNKEMILKYHMRPVVYIIYVGKYNGIHLFKYGLTRDIMRRIYREHKKQFDTCKVIYIGDCVNCEAVEQLFEDHMISLKLHREVVINDKNQTELFTVTTSHTHDDAIDKMIEFVDNNKLPETKEIVNKIGTMANLTDEMQKIIIEFIQSKNYIHTLDAQLRLKDKEIKLKEIELQTEQIRLKQMAMKKGADVDTGDDIFRVLPPLKKKPKSRKNIVVL
jgi:prophage antirepressor-like protein